MFTIKSELNDFPKTTGKRYKVIVNAGGGLFGYIITNFMSYLDFVNLENLMLEKISRT